ncbi:hypothetical protein BH11ARM2_BH11ARM2_39740 [soil metagenome]
MKTTPRFREFDQRATAGEPLNVVFFGASLTWGANASDPQLTSYRARVGQRLQEAYPKAPFRFWDAAIGGTGSQLGVFRLDRDVLSRKPDLVFLDFSANDNIHTDDEETLASYESLIRRILTETNAPIVQVVLPFKQDAEAGDTSTMLRRTAHHAISHVYRTGFGDAITLMQKRIKQGQTTADALWPYDGGHPCDAGYELFAEAAWAGFREGIEKDLQTHIPTEPLYGDTYLTNARVRLSTLGPLPEGWRMDHPNLTAAFFDMLMSRWLDDEVVATGPTPFKIRFRGTMALLFGESTPQSARFRVILDEEETEHDAGWLGVPARGNGHLSFILGQDLDPDREHTLEIVPLIEPGSDGELRLESLCVAGKKAAVFRAESQNEAGCA